MTAERALRDQIVALIKKNGDRGISFAQFMELALYDPEFGYYSRPRLIGRKGDFYTSVSVGPCFGMLLARKIREVQQLLGEPEGFTVIEQGAHDGQLAADILAELGQSTRYQIIEPSEGRRKAQRDRLGNRVEFLDANVAAPPRSGVFICNELVDAFPVHRLQFQNGDWRELRVTLERDEFTERAFDLTEVLREFVPTLGNEPADGFQTEICPAATTWAKGLPGMFQERGVYLIIDYGLTADEFLTPERREGTLRCFRDHQATDDPFEAIGETDITFQINFTQLQNAAESAGLTVAAFEDQSRFLTRIAADWLRELDGQAPTPSQAALLRQFQTLTHPGLMGRVFKCLTLSQGIVDPKE